MVVGIRLVCLTYIQLLGINHNLHKVASTLLLIPITITRIASADGDKVPPWAAALTAAVFDTTGASLSRHVQSSKVLTPPTLGLVNALLHIYLDTSNTNTLPISSPGLQKYDQSVAKGSFPMTSHSRSERQEKTHQEHTSATAIPVVPQNTYIPPAEWMSTAPLGRRY